MNRKTVRNGKKPRVCFLRGSFLSPLEIQALSALEKEFDLQLIRSKYHRFDLSQIDLPIEEVNCLDYLNGMIPHRIAGRKLPNPFKYFGYEEVLLGLDRLVERFDLIHLPEQSFYFTWQIAKRKPRYGYRIVTMQDEVNPFWYSHNRAISRRAGLVRRETDLFIAASERAKSALLCEGIEREKIRVIGDGVDMSLFHPGPRDPGLCSEMVIAPDRFIILFIGRLIWTKGIFTLVDAAKLLLLDPVVGKLDPLFVMIGEGSEKSTMLKKIDRLGLSQSFKVIGHQPYSRLPDLHRLADIFVLPSISTRFVLEQNPYVMMESMATAKPVISTYCGAIDEIVGDSGLLVQANDYYRLYQALKQLCTEPDLRAKFGEKALERIKKKFSHKVISAALASAYRDALSR